MGEGGVGLDRWVRKWLMDGNTSGCLVVGCVNRWMNGWFMDRWLNRWTDNLKSGWEVG